MIFFLTIPVAKIIKYKIVYIHTAERRYLHTCI